MQVKKFEAPTIQEALDAIKRELGPEAIILQTKKNKKGFGLMSKPSVEVTAAVSGRALHKKQLVETRLPQAKRNELGQLPANRQADVYDDYLDRRLDQAARQTRDQVSVNRGKGPASAASVQAKKMTATRYIDIEDEGGSRSEAPSRKPAPSVAVSASGAASVSTDTARMEQELQQLKDMISELRENQETPSGSGTQSLLSMGTFSTPALHEAFEMLVVNGVDKRYAITLLKQAHFSLGSQGSAQAEQVLDQLAMEIMENTEVSPALDGILPRSQQPERKDPVIFALVGPTGVGKTTTIAKIAGEAILQRGLRVGLINIDNYKVAASDQLATYAKILNVPFRSVGTEEELQLAVREFQAYDLILIDTAGYSQRDTESLQRMSEWIHALPGARAELVLSTSTRDTELYDIAKRFSVFRPEGLILSKLDEALAYGGIYNISQKTKLPLVYFTTGQRVPEDIEVATKERMASLVMDL